MYKKILFQNGAKAFQPFQKRNINNYHGGRGTYNGCGRNIDNYLLSVINGVENLKIPKITSHHKKKGGNGLKFCR